MFEFIYPATTKIDEDGRVLVTFPDVHGAVTDGADLVEALQEAPDCLAEAIAAAMVAGEDLPEPSAAKRNQVLIPLPASIAMKAMLYMAMREQKRTNTWLAKQLQINEKEARRMLDPYHATKLPRMNEALHALGKEMVIGFKNAATRS
jgi:antitoxin HicB